MTKEEIQLLGYQFIGFAGDAISSYFEALKKAKQGDFDAAKALMEAGNASMVEAHNGQTELLSAEARGDDFELPLIMVHAQDHLMNAVLAERLIEEMIALYKDKQAKA